MEIKILDDDKIMVNGRYIIEEIYIKGTLCKTWEIYEDLSGKMETTDTDDMYWVNGDFTDLKSALTSLQDYIEENGDY